MGNEYYPEVVQCFAGENASIFAYFSDGTIHLYDARQLLERGGIFERLRDERFFREALTVLNGTVAWDVSGCFDPTTCIDIDPFTVYDSPAVEDPLESAA